MPCAATGKDNCNCTYTACSRRGNCCQCVAYHAPKGEFTACFFSAEMERAHVRSLAQLIHDRQQRDGSLTV